METQRAWDARCQVAGHEDRGVSSIYGGQGRGRTTDAGCGQATCGRADSGISGAVREQTYRQRRTKAGRRDDGNSSLCREPRMTISPRSLARCGLVGGGWVVWEFRSAGNNRKASGDDAESEGWVCRGVVKTPVGAEAAHRGRRQADDGDDGDRRGVESVKGGAFVVRIPGASHTRGYVCLVSGGSGSRSWEGEGCVFRGSLHALRWYPRGEKKRGTLTEVGARQDQGGSWEAKRGPRGNLSGSRGEVRRRGRCYRSRR